MSQFALAGHATALIGGEARSGKTTFAMGLSRWMHLRGVHVAPLHLSSPGHWDPVPCPEGGEISWPAALLAEACGLPPEAIFENGQNGARALLPRFDALVVESRTHVSEPGLILVGTFRNETSFGVHIDGQRTVFDGPAPLMALQQEDDAIRRLPRWRLGTSPRCGIISLPHLLGFANWALVRGAEWLAAPGIGYFDFLFLPESSDPLHDWAWLDESGLTLWITQQLRSGARLVSADMEFPGATVVNPSVFSDYRQLSMLTGVRWPAPLPDAKKLDDMADWVEAGLGEAVLSRFLP